MREREPLELLALDAGGAAAAAATTPAERAQHDEDEEHAGRRRASDARGHRRPRRGARAGCERRRARPSRAVRAPNAAPARPAPRTRRPAHRTGASAATAAGRSGTAAAARTPIGVNHRPRTAGRRSSDRARPPGCAELGLVVVTYSAVGDHRRRSAGAPATSRIGPIGLLGPADRQQRADAGEHAERGRDAASTRSSPTRAGARAATIASATQRPKTGPRRGASRSSQAILFGQVERPQGLQRPPCPSGNRYGGGGAVDARSTSSGAEPSTCDAGERPSSSSASTSTAVAPSSPSGIATVVTGGDEVGGHRQLVVGDHRQVHGHGTRRACGRRAAARWPGRASS